MRSKGFCYWSEVGTPGAVKDTSEILICPRCGGIFAYGIPGCSVCYELSNAYMPETILEKYQREHRFPLQDAEDEEHNSQ